MIGPASILLIQSGLGGAALAEGLASAAEQLVQAGDGPGARPLGLESRAAVRQGLSDLIAEHGRPAGVVVAIAGAPALTPRPIERFSDADWEAAVNAPLRRSLFVIQALHALFPHDPPPVVFVGATTGLTGAPELGALAAVAEGQRALAKVASRQWGEQGWRVNWVGLDPAVLAPSLSQAEAVRLPEAEAPAIGRTPVAEEVAPVLSLLFDPRAQALAGATLVLDGGYWMLP